MKICRCDFNYNKGIGLGVCLSCGGLTCNKYGGCFIPNHNCNNAKVSRK